MGSVQGISPEGTVSAPSFRLEDVSRQWGRRIAVRNLSLDINPGEIVALVGPSGGGKSTVIRMLAGVLRPTAGTVWVSNRDIATFSPRELRKHRARCRMVEQDHLLVPQLSVHQNIVAGQASCWPWYKVVAAALWPIDRAHVRTLLESLGIAGHQWNLASELSGGQKQRVTIARALVSEPSALLADEPTASLDPATAKSVTEILLTEVRKRGVTSVFCTHWLDLVLDRVDRVVGLREGCLVLDAKSSEVTQSALDYLYEGSCERVRP
jgi:phosphonate transport system ATP-binding protein